MVELIGGEIAERLVEAPRFVAVVPSEEGVLEPAKVSGQVGDVVELIVIRAEGAFDVAVAVRAIGPLEVVGEAVGLQVPPSKAIVRER